MLLNFTTAGGRIFTVEAEKTEIAFNYSQMQNLSQGRGFIWQRITGHDELYYGKDEYHTGWYGSTSVQDVNTLIHTYHIGESNVITMSVNPSDQFYGKDAEQNKDGVVMFTNDNSNFKFSFFTRLEYVAGEQISVAHCGAFFLVNPYGYSGTTQTGLNGNACQNMYKYETDTDKIPAMSFWILTMHDDIQSSATYGEDFEILMICVRGGVLGGGASFPDTFNFYDMRLFKGVDIRTPSKSTTRGNSPTGWTGGRSDRSDSDTESHIGTALRAFVNNFEYGTHLYRLSHNQMQDFFTYLWSDNIWDSSDRETNNPIRGVISLHHMPTHVTAKGVQECVKLCGKQAVIYGTGGIFAQQVMADVAAENKVELKTKVFHPEGYSDSFLDWGGNTRIKFRLPFIGVVPVNANAIMDGGIFAKYNIDFITGNCLVQIYTIPQKAVMGTDEDWSETYSGCLVMLAQYAGNCAHKLNVSTCDFGGATAMGSIVSSVVSIGTVAAGALTENPMLMLAGAGATLKSGTNAAMTHENMSVIGATPNADTMGIMVPALIIERPIDLTPLDDQGRGKRYQDFVGRPAASGGKVKDYKVGFEDGQVFIQGILHADTLYATEAEKKEIEAGFAKGMYV